MMSQRLANHERFREGVGSATFQAKKKKPKEKFGGNKEHKPPILLQVEAKRTS